MNEIWFCMISYIFPPTQHKTIFTPTEDFSFHSFNYILNIEKDTYLPRKHPVRPHVRLGGEFIVEDSLGSHPAQRQGELRRPEGEILARVGSVAAQRGAGYLHVERRGQEYVTSGEVTVN